MERGNKKVDNGIILKFKPIIRTISLFCANNKTLERKKFNEWALDYPTRVVFEIESLCNSGCKYCSYGNNKKNGARIPKEKVFQILDELDKMKIFELSLRGGEPTVHPDFMEIWEYAQKKKFLTTNVITNGLILNYEKAKKLLKNPKAKIIISLDGFSETNSQHRNPHQYGLVMSWLPAILKEHPFQIVILTCLYKDSEKKALEFSEYLAGLGLKFHNFPVLKRQGNALFFDSKIFLSLEEMKEIQKKLNAIKNKFPDFRPIISCGEVHQSYYQDLQNIPVPLFNEIYQSSTLRITARGDVLVCSGAHFSEYFKKNIKEKDYLGPLGSVYNDSLESIWLSSKKIREKQIEIAYKYTPFLLGWKDSLK